MSISRVNIIALVVFLTFFQATTQILFRKQLDFLPYYIIGNISRYNFDFNKKILPFLRTSR